jgi:hypothetical protein
MDTRQIRHRRTVSKRRILSTRRQIEVYFILYLAAILFLLPNKREQSPDSDPNLVLKVLSSRFFIAPEKLTLNCQIQTIGSTTSIVQLDSVNTITFSGDYTNVHYEFFVEDALLRQNVVAMSARKSIAGAFRMEEDDRRGVATFFWTPDLRDRRSRTFTVRVVATARPVVPATITDPTLRQKLQAMIDDASRVDTAETSFTINVVSFGASDQIVFNDSLRASTTTSGTVVVNGATLGGSQPTFRLPPDFRPPAPGDFTLVPQNSIIETLPFQTWSTAVLVSGEINLRNNTPKINVARSDPNDTQGSAYMTDLGSNLIRIAGIAPSSGVMTVQVVLTRTEDNKRSVAEFTVRSSPLQRPVLPQKMFPGITYEIKPQLDFLTGQELRAALLELGGKERYSSPQGSTFAFTPLESDVGKTLTFERYVNGRRVGDVYTVVIEDFPPPEIVEIVPEGRLLLVRTRCFGTVGGQINRVVLDASKLQNAIIRERYGDLYRNDDRQETSQLFEIRRADADKSISGMFRALDRKNRASLIKQLDR